jgi:hypothetical protein
MVSIAALQERSNLYSAPLSTREDPYPGTDIERRQVSTPTANV